MGCDGGTIPRRDELVRLKKKPEMKDKIAETDAKWRNCSISQNRLVEPIYACELGRMYNKEAVIEYLLNKEGGPSLAKHIRNLKDVIPLSITPNKDFSGKLTSNGDSYIDTQRALYICPVAGIEMSGSHKFCFLWKCGCVLSDRGLKAAKSELCHKCGKSYEKSDIVIINGNEEDITKMTENMEIRREKLKLEKKMKKSKDKKRSASSVEKNENGASKSDVTEPKLTKKDYKKILSGRKKNEKTDDSTRKIKPEYSVIKDPNASEAYKSLFTSHESAKNKVSAHWVTFNPFYN